MTGQVSWGVIFDMDGVLVDSAAAHFESWQRLAAEEGITITREQFEAGFGRQNRDIIPMFFGPVSTGRLASIARRKEEIYRDLICAKVPAVGGASELVLALAKEGIPLAVGSAGPLQNIEMVLKGMHILSCFQVIVSGEDASRGKPDPQVFQIACDRLGLPPEKCIVIEDAIAGVKAACAAGTRVVGIVMHESQEKLKEAGADLVVRQLRDLNVAQLRKLVTG